MQDAVNLVTDLYYRARFGGYDLDDADEVRLREALRLSKPPPARRARLRRRKCRCVVAQSGQGQGPEQVACATAGGRVHGHGGASPPWQHSGDWRRPGASCQV